MTTQEKIQYSLVIVCVIIGAFIGLALKSIFVPKVSVGANSSDFTNVQTNTIITAGPTTSTAALSANSGRQWVIIQNVGANTAYLGFGTPAVASKGVGISPSSTFTIDLEHLYTGSITAIAGGATTTLSITEFKQSH